MLGLNYSIIAHCIARGSGILPVNAHAEVNILNLNYMNKFII